MQKTVKKTFPTDSRAAEYAELLYHIFFLNLRNPLISIQDFKGLRKRFQITPLRSQRLRASARVSSFDNSRILHCVRDYAMASTVRCNGTLDEKR